MDPVIRDLGGTDAAVVASIARASRKAAMPWLPDLHTPAEDVGFFAGELATSRAWGVEVDGALSGFAIYRGGWLTHLYLMPDQRGRGLGSALVEQVRFAVDGPIDLWVFEDNQDARAFYAARGFVEVERTDGSGNEEKQPDVRMRLAPQVLVRAARESDAEAIASVHVRGWQAGYDGLVAADYLAAMRPADRVQRWRDTLTTSDSITVVAVADRQVVGFAHGGPTRDDDVAPQQQPVQEVYSLYVDPAHWRRGAGSLLWRGLVDRLGPDGSAITVWALADNRRARAFYAVMGLASDGVERDVRVGNQSLAEVRMARWR